MFLEVSLSQYLKVFVGSQEVRFHLNSAEFTNSKLSDFTTFQHNFVCPNFFFGNDQKKSRAVHPIRPDQCSKSVLFRSVDRSRKGRNEVKGLSDEKKWTVDEKYCPDEQLDCLCEFFVHSPNKTRSALS